MLGALRRPRCQRQERDAAPYCHCGADALGNLAADMQDAVAAREWFAQAPLVAVDIGDMSSVARCLESFASLALEEANPVLAATLYGSAEALRQSIAVPATATASVVVVVVVVGFAIMRRANFMSSVKSDIVAVLGRGPRKARFVPELCSQLAGANAVDVDRALAELENDGRVVIREQYCPDPHLDGMDLRIAALVVQSHSEDAIGRAMKDINTTWERWLTEYLANHRCG